MVSIHFRPPPRRDGTGQRRPFSHWINIFISSPSSSSFLSYVLRYPRLFSSLLFFWRSLPNCYLTNASSAPLAPPRLDDNGEEKKRINILIERNRVRVHAAQDPLDPHLVRHFLPSPPLLSLVQYVKRKGELHQQQRRRRRRRHRHQTITYCTTVVVAVQLSSSIQSFVRLPYANATTLCCYTALDYTTLCVCVCARATHTNDGRCRGFKFESTFHYVQSALPPRDLFISSLSGAATTTTTTPQPWTSPNR